MPSIKISELPNVVNLGSGIPSDDIMMIIQQNISKKMSVYDFLGNLNYPVKINANKNGTTGFSVNGNGTDNLFVVNPFSNNVGIGPRPADLPVEIQFPLPSAKLDVAGNIRVHGNYIEASEYIIPPLGVNGQPTAADYTSVVQLVAEAGIISNQIAITAISVHGDSLYQLSEGTHGQEKTILICSEAGGTIIVPPKASIDMTNNSLGGKTQIILKGPGTSISLKYIFIDNIAHGWVVVGQYGNVTVN